MSEKFISYLYNSFSLLTLIILLLESDPTMWIGLSTAGGQLRTKEKGDPTRREPTTHVLLVDSMSWVGSDFEDRRRRWSDWFLSTHYLGKENSFISFSLLCGKTMALWRCRTASWNLLNKLLHPPSRLPCSNFSSGTSLSLSVFITFFFKYLYFKVALDLFSCLNFEKSFLLEVENFRSQIREYGIRMNKNSFFNFRVYNLEFRV